MKCVKCDSMATIPVGNGLVAPEWWWVCDQHVSWFNPAWMPRWWFWVSGALVALMGASLIVTVLLLTGAV